MRILVSIGHPAHVHFFKNFIWEMEKRGHTIGIVTKDREMALKLLDVYGFDYYKISTPVVKGPLNPISLKNFIKFIYQNSKVAKDFKPKICTGIGAVGLTYAAKLVGAKSIVFTDNEDRHVKANKITMPFADLVCTPNNFTDDYGQKHIRYLGYHELAYLHPNWFKPNHTKLENFDFDINATNFIVRFTKWNVAAHDINQYGFSRKNKEILVRELSKLGNVYITSESKLPPQFEKFRMAVSPHLIHHLLYYSDLYIGDSQTMASEAAVLGTPAIRSNSFVGEDDISIYKELENEYGLVFNFQKPNQAIKKAIKIAQRNDIKNLCRRRLNKLLNDKIDVTEFMVNLFEKFDEKKI